MEKLFLSAEIFIFVLSCLNVIQNIFKFLKVLWVKQGKFEITTISKLFFGLSLSYIITQLIVGF